ESCRNAVMKIYPKCLKGKQSYVSSDGHWLPCCWLPSFGEHYENSIFSKPEFDLTLHAIEKAAKNDAFREFIRILLEDPARAPYTCKKHCRRDSESTSNDLNQQTTVS
ncbi:MAG: hypothetical protein Q8P24_06905, partial [Desulfobacterales bacterium]|nr:hypothetical protein [Desulfobacterales bacterium]